MKIVFLGTNGWYDTETGSTICTLINTRDYYILLDAGIGIYKADKYIKRDKPVLLFLSHFHHDHIFGLHILFKFNFKSLKIFGQPGTKKTIAEYLGPKFSVPLTRLSYKTEIVDMEEGWHNTPLKFRCLKLKHASTCFGYRFEIENKIISYCTDTGYCDNAVELSRDAHLLISECSLSSGHVTPDWPHLNPELAAKLAKEADSKKLALTHFDANVYRIPAKRDEAEKKARKIFKNAFAAKDGTSLIL